MNENADPADGAGGAALAALAIKEKAEGPLVPPGAVLCGVTACGEKNSSSRRLHVEAGAGAAACGAAATGGALNESSSSKFTVAT